MTLPRNFHDRRNARRKRALANMPKRENRVAAANEMLILGERITSAARHIRTKKVRAGRRT